MLLGRLRKREEGNSILEYVLLLVVFGLSVAAAVRIVGKGVGGAFSHASTTTSVAASAGKIVGTGNSMRIAISDFHHARPRTDRETDNNSDRSATRAQTRHNVPLR